MPHPIEIENIDEMRRRQGIDDAELHEQIRRLTVGDFVKLTLLTGEAPSVNGETLVVRITSIRGGQFRGKLTDRPVSRALSELPAGAPVRFSAGHIQSILIARAKREG